MSTSALDSGGGDSAKARPSQATAAAGAPRASATPATRRKSSTRPASPVGSASTSWAAIRSSVASQRLEDQGGTGVGVGEPAWADVGPYGLPHYRVGELQALRRPENVEGDQLVGGGRYVLVGELGHHCRLGEAGAVAEHRDRSHQRARCSGGSRQA